MAKFKIKKCATKDCDNTIRYLNIPKSRFCKDCYFEKQRIKFEKHKKTKVYQKEVRNEVEKLRKKCVALSKKISKEEQGYKCQYCGVGREQRMLHSHHIFHEGLHRSMSADVDNLLTLCATHHQGGSYMKSHDGFNFHNSPIESTQWLMENHSELYQKLKRRSMKYNRLDIQFWEAKLEELKNYKINR